MTRPVLYLYRMVLFLVALNVIGDVLRTTMDPKEGKL